MPNATNIIAPGRPTAPLDLIGQNLATTGNIQIPSNCNLIRVWGSGAGGGGGGGFAGATGGGGGGGGGASAVIGLDIPVVPGEVLTYQLDAVGVGGAVGAPGTPGGSQTYIRRAGFSLLRLREGKGGTGGLETAGGTGGGGAEDINALGGAGGTNANAAIIGPTTINTGQLIASLALPFYTGSPGGGGTYSASGTTFVGGRSLPVLGHQLDGTPGSTAGAVGGGAGGAGGVCWPSIHPVSSGVTPLPPNGGNDNVAGSTPNIFGCGGGGGGRNAAGGNGGPAFLSITFL